MDDSWPGFTNTDEECIACKGPPGANGCREIETIYRCAENVKVMHSSETEYQPEAIAISYFWYKVDCLVLITIGDMWEMFWMVNSAMKMCIFA